MVYYKYCIVKHRSEPWGMWSAPSEYLIHKTSSTKAPTLKISERGS